MHVPGGDSRSDGARSGRGDGAGQSGPGTRVGLSDFLMSLDRGSGLSILEYCKASGGLTYISDVCSCFHLQKWMKGGTLELGVLMKPAPRTPGEKVVLCGVGVGGMELGGVLGTGPEEEALGRILGPPALQPWVLSPCPTPSTCFLLLLPETSLGDPRAPKLLQGHVVNASHVSPRPYLRGCNALSCPPAGSSFSLEDNSIQTCHSSF